MAQPRGASARLTCSFERKGPARRHTFECRTVRGIADAGGKPTLRLPSSPRVTRVGRIAQARDFCRPVSTAVGCGCGDRHRSRPLSYSLASQSAPERRCAEEIAPFSASLEAIRREARCCVMTEAYRVFRVFRKVGANPLSTPLISLLPLSQLTTAKRSFLPKYTLLTPPQGPWDGRLHSTSNFRFEVRPSALDMLISVSMASNLGLLQRRGVIRWHSSGT